MNTNGSNPRPDRIERLIKQRERASKEAHARHKREMAKIRDRERKDDAIFRQWAAQDRIEERAHRKEMKELEAQSAQAQARTKQILREIGEKLNRLLGKTEKPKRRRQECY